MEIHIHHYHHFDCDNPSEVKQLLGELLRIATQNTQTLKEILMTDQELSTLLDQVNATTNGIAAIQISDATVLATVKSELDTLIASAGQSGGISDATAAKLTALATAVSGVQTNATSNSTLLTAIAAEGSPVVPPPPTPPTNP